MRKSRADGTGRRPPFHEQDSFESLLAVPGARGAQRDRSRSCPLDASRKGT